MDKLLDRLRLAFIYQVAWGNYKSTGNDRHSAFLGFIGIMDSLAQKGWIRCDLSAQSEMCHLARVVSTLYASPGKSRVYTIVGSDGLIITVNAVDAELEIKINVMDPRGKSSTESLDADEAWQRVQAGFERRYKNLMAMYDEREGMAPVKPMKISEMSNM